MGQMSGSKHHHLTGVDSTSEVSSAFLLLWLFWRLIFEPSAVTLHNRDERLSAV